MKKTKNLKSGYAAKKFRERSIFYKPLSDGFKKTCPPAETADLLMPAQFIKVK